MQSNDIKATNSNVTVNDSYIQNHQSKDYILELDGVTRAYQNGSNTVEVLHGIDLKVERGEFLAIIGPSGSGKSTLMNILGCLDTPTTGSYKVNGQDTHALMPDELASLRRNFFGFIFQRYHLLGHLNASENVEVPSVYSGVRRNKRHQRALALLKSLGLDNRAHHKPSELSGGQQQRVSIARALINGGQIILADEPTGALDRHSGLEVLKILKELNVKGHTIIIVTHDPSIATKARRIVSIEDGYVVKDEINKDFSYDDNEVINQSQSVNYSTSVNAQDDVQVRTRAQVQANANVKDSDKASLQLNDADSASAQAKAHAPSSTLNSDKDAKTKSYTKDTSCSSSSFATDDDDILGRNIEINESWSHSVFSYLDRFKEAFSMALRAMFSNRLRTLLTMLGIIIGIMAVVSVVALARGASEKVIANIAALGTNTITIYPGSRMGDVRSGRVRSLTSRDLVALEGQPFVDSATTSIQTSVLMRYGALEYDGSVYGVSADLFRVQGIVLDKGRFFSKSDIDNNMQVGVIDINVAENFFKNEDPLGKVILVNKLPIKIVGVLAEQRSAFVRPDSLQIYIPYTAVMSRLLNQDYLSSIIIRIKEGFSTPVAEKALVNLLKSRHGRQDFFVQSTDTIMKSINEATMTFTIMISAIAVISLIVGGIGVMNIMLVSVTERTREIGIRMAVGARQSDIMAQFLIESVVVCIIGGLLGVIFSYLTSFVVSYINEEIVMSFSVSSIIVAVVTSSAIGIAFGFMPARSASRLNPIEALARE